MVTALLLTCLIPVAPAATLQAEFDRRVAEYQRRADLQPNNPELWYALSTLYAEKLQKEPGLSRAVARKYALQGLEFVSRALLFNASYYEALNLKDILLRKQAQYVTDPILQKKLIAEADAYKAAALKVREHPESGSAAASERSRGSR